MNSLEDRVRAAVQATAAEIAPDDVPPMRPLGAGSGGSRRRTGRGSGGARGAAWRWGAPLAAAAAVLAVVAAASLLAGVRPSHVPGPAAARPTKPAHRAHATASYPPDLQAGLTGFFLPASGAQFTAGALFMGEYTALEEKISSACMAGHGYLVPVATPAEIARPVWDLTQFPDLGAIARAGALPSYSVGPGPGESKAYQQAAQHCDALSRVPFTSMRGASASLVNSWLPIVTTIQASAPVTATLPGLRSCAARYGWPAQPYGAPDSAINSFADFVGWVAGHLDGADSRGASAAQLNALDRHWGAVFVACARPTVAVMEKLQLAAQQTFLREHRRQFAALVATARADFARAGRLAGQ